MKYVFVLAVLFASCGRAALSLDDADTLITKDLELNKNLIIHVGSSFKENKTEAIKNANYLMRNGVVRIGHRSEEGYHLIPEPSIKKYILSPTPVPDSGALSLVFQLGSLFIKDIKEVTIDHKLDKAYITCIFSLRNQNLLTDIFLGSTKEMKAQLIYQWNDGRWIRRTEEGITPEIIKYKIAQLIPLKAHSASQINP